MAFSPYLPFSLRAKLHAMLGHEDAAIEAQGWTPASCHARRPGRCKPPQPLFKKLEPPAGIEEAAP